MTSLDSRKTVDPPHDTYKFEAGPDRYENLPQANQSPRHSALITCVGPRVWVDEWGVMGDHNRFWNREVGGRFEGGWEPGNYPEKAFAVSVMPNDAVKVHHPQLKYASAEDLVHVAHFLREFGVPEDTRIHWDVDAERWQRVFVGRLYQRAGV